LLPGSPTALWPRAAELGIELPPEEATDRRSRARRRTCIERVFDQTPNWPDVWREIDSLLQALPVTSERPDLVDLVDFVRLRLVRRIVACPSTCEPDRRKPSECRLARRWLRLEIGRLIGEWRAEHTSEAPSRIEQLNQDVEAPADDVLRDYRLFHEERDGSTRLRLLRPGSEEGTVRVTIVRVAAGAAPGEGDMPTIVDEFELARDTTDDKIDHNRRLAAAEWWSEPFPARKRVRVPQGFRLVMEVQWLPP
jgi:hypothetical protein